MLNMDTAWPKICFLAGMWTMALIVSASQNRIEAFVALLVAPLMAGILLYLINYFGIKWLERK